ncbi:hypothetical protein LXL04_039788 [Taraxacum kok-saghyz]
MSSPHDSNTVNDTTNSTAQDSETIDKSKLRSPIWDHFDLKKIKGTQMAICNYCNKNYKKVFFRLKQREPQYKSLPDENEWALATELCERLKIFYSVTELFSGTKYPTTNLFFPKICEIKLSLKKWDNSNFIEISRMASNMITKFDQYWQESHGVMAMATILDPRFKMKILEFYFPLIYGVDEAKSHVLIAKKTCENIFEQYVLRSESQKSNADSVPIFTQKATPEVETESLDAFFFMELF